LGVSGAEGLTKNSYLLITRALIALLQVIWTCEIDFHCFQDRKTAFYILITLFPNDEDLQTEISFFFPAIAFLKIRK
jgi:hypothetical protein